MTCSPSTTRACVTRPDTNGATTTCRYAFGSTTPERRMLLDVLEKMTGLTLTPARCAASSGRVMTRSAKGPDTGAAAGAGDARPALAGAFDCGLQRYEAPTPAATSAAPPSTSAGHDTRMPFIARLLSHGP